MNESKGETKSGITIKSFSEGRAGKVEVWNHERKWIELYLSGASANLDTHSLYNALLKIQTFATSVAED